MHLIRRLAMLPPEQQFTTAITVGELLHGAFRVGRETLTARVEEVVRSAQTVLPFDAAAARVFARLRTDLERIGTPLAEPDLRIAAIAVHHDLVMVTRNVRHFGRVPGLVVENWID